MHLLRTSTAFVYCDDVCKDLKPVDQAVDALTAEKALEAFEQSDMGKRYPPIEQTWCRVSAQVVPFFQFPPEIHTLLYTINRIERLNRFVRNVIKTQSLFPGTKACLSGDKELHGKLEESISKLVSGYAAIRVAIWRSIY